MEGTLQDLSAHYGRYRSLFLDLQKTLCDFSSVYQTSYHSWLVDFGSEVSDVCLLGSEIRKVRLQLEKWNHWAAQVSQLPRSLGSLVVNEGELVQLESLLAKEFDLKQAEEDLETLVSSLKRLKTTTK